MDIADQQHHNCHAPHLLGVQTFWGIQDHPAFHATHMIIVVLLFYTISGQFLHVCAGRISHHGLPYDKGLVDDEPLWSSMTMGYTWLYWASTINHDKGSLASLVIGAFLSGPQNHPTSSKSDHPTAPHLELIEIQRAISILIGGQHLSWTSLHQGEVTIGAVD